MKRYWFLATLGIALALNGTLAFLVWSERDGAIQAATDVASLAAAQNAEHMDELMDIVDRTMSGVGEVLAVYENAGDSGDPYVHRLLVRRHSITPSIKDLFIVSPDGRARYDSLNPTPPPIDVSDRDYVQHHLDGATDRLFIGKPVVSRLDGRWIVPASRRVEDRFGRLEAIVAVALEPDIFISTLDQSPLPAGMRAAILSSSGDVLGCLPRTECLGRSATAWPVFSHLSQASGATVALRHVSLLPGTVGPGAYRVSSRNGIVAVVAIDTEGAVAGWRRRLPVFIALGVVVNLGGTLVSLALYRQVIRRRRALRELAEANACLERRVVERTAALQRSEEQLRAFIATARDAMLVIDGRGTILVFNPAAAVLFGYPAAQVVGESINMLMPSGYAAEHDRHVHGARRKVGRVGANREMIARHRDGSEFPIELTVGSTESDGGTIHVGVLRDIRERKLQEERLWQLANFDGLTGVLNRRAFMERGAALVDAGRRSGGPVSVLMLDADRFKAINDTHGHQIGDEVLKSLAGVLSRSVRAGDLLGRLGGEEFAIVLPDTGADGAAQLAERMLGDVREARVALSDGEVRFTVSAGAAVLGDHADLATLLAHADQALYAAKEAGRDRCVIAG